LIYLIRSIGCTTIILVDEDTYFAEREEELVARLVRGGHTRREVLRRGAAGAFLLAGVGRVAAAGGTRAATTTGPIVKPLPAEWFIDYGTNAEMRWDAVPGLGYFIPNERFFIRDHTASPCLMPAPGVCGYGGMGCVARPLRPTRSA
jgi:hypothetical protein